MTDNILVWTEFAVWAGPLLTPVICWLSLLITAPVPCHQRRLSARLLKKKQKAVQKERDFMLQFYPFAELVGFHSLFLPQLSGRSLSDVSVMETVHKEQGKRWKKRSGRSTNHEGPSQEPASLENCSVCTSTTVQCTVYLNYTDIKSHPLL